MSAKSALFVGSAVVVAALAACSSDALSPSSPALDASAPIPPVGVDASVDATPLDAGAPAYVWDLPKGFPLPRVPKDNPMSEAKVALGRRLFFDVRLSGNGKQSCGSCHEPAKAFTDGRATSLGSTGEAHPRGAMSLANVGYAAALTWANPILLTLEQQAVVPMFGDAPVELGMKDDATLVARLAADAEYPAAFAKAFPGAEKPISLDHVTKALASFQRTIVSGDSPYDRYLRGDVSAITESQRRGGALFFSEKVECYHCHGGFAFSDSAVSEGSFFELSFHNTGLYDVDGKGAYPEPNRGLIDVTGKPEHMGRFRAPTLRNIAVTAPYFHDGSAKTLSDVIDHYAAGGRTIASGPFAGDGSKSPLKSDLLIGFTLTAQERQDLLAFLESLTDAAFLANPKFQDPFPKVTP
jgi:cytochrome c peroxidase